MAWKENILFPLLSPLVKIGIHALSRARLPQTRGKIKVEGLQAPVEILRDRWGAAHIYAGSAEDALFGQGFVHAQERLWQMDFTRRAVCGRLAEILGESALPFDRAMRTLGLRRVAQREADVFASPLREWVAAYCAGASAWIEIAIARQKLPVEFLLLGYTPEPWQPVDVTSWGKLMCWTLSANWQCEFLRAEIAKRLGTEKAAALQITSEQAWSAILDAGGALAGGAALNATRAYTGAQAGEGAGSNSWAVHGARTAGGLPLLANDMHISLAIPSLWYENHLSGGELQVTGVSVPGVPFVVSGHNGKVAWGFSAGLADVQDLYEEHLRPDGQGGWQAEFRGAWEPVALRHEEMRVKGGKTIVEEVRSTRHGPIVNCLFDQAYPDSPPLALRWTAFEPETLMEAIGAMCLAGDCRAFHRALGKFSGPSMNTIYADIQGNIAYTLAGRVPIRAKGDGTLPARGWCGEEEWIGLIPFEELPHLQNPPQGFISSANNPVHRADFPYHVGLDFSSSDRAARIDELLRANPRVDIAYFQKMHFDQVSWSARILAAHLGRLTSSDAELQVIIDHMRVWDGDLSVDSPLAPVYAATLRQALGLVLERHLGDLAGHIKKGDPIASLWHLIAREWFIQLLETPDSPWFDLGGGEHRDDVLRMALRRAVDQLRALLGPDRRRWRWGQLNRLSFTHTLGENRLLERAFNLGRYPIGGDASTLWAAFAEWPALRGDHWVGPPFRFIADLGDLDHCLGLMAPGQSGHPASRHYADGIQAFFSGQYHPMLFKKEEVEKEVQDRLVLE